MHRTVEQILQCYVTAWQTDWDLLLPLCKFALNSTKSASMGYTPAMVLYGHEPVLPVEHAVCDVTDGPV